jgi:hypothetical protein
VEKGVGKDSLDQEGRQSETVSAPYLIIRERFAVGGGPGVKGVTLPGHGGLRFEGRSDQADGSRR